MTWTRLGRFARWIGGTGAVLILLWTVRAAWIEFRTEQIAFDAGRFLVAVFLLAGAYVGFAALWREIASALGTRVRFDDTIQLWSFSNLGRYLPGKVWQVVGLVVLARDLGVPPGVATAVAVVALGFMVCSGALVGFVFLPGVMDLHPAVILGIGATASGLLVPLVRPDALTGILRRLPKRLGCRDVEAISRPVVLRLEIYFVGLWLAHGSTFWVMTSAFAPVTVESFFYLSGAYALSYVIGLVAIFAPGGVGVREGVLAHFLGIGPVEGIQPHALAIVARVWTLLGEVLILLLALGLRLNRMRRTS